jgi:flavorubredoxin
MRMYDVSKTHPSFIISDVWKYSHMVLASPTYNLNLYYPMDALLREMAALGLKNRKAAILGCHSWASAAVREMKTLVCSMKNMELIGDKPIDICSTLKSEREAELDTLADAICASLEQN